MDNSRSEFPDCRILEQTQSSMTTVGVVFKISDIVIAYVVVPSSLLLISSYTHLPAAKQAHRGTNVALVVYHVLRTFVVGLGQQLRLPWTRLYKIDLYLDNLPLVLLYFVLIMTSITMERSVIAFMDNHKLRKTAFNVKTLHYVTSYIYTVYLILREKSLDVFFVSKSNLIRIICIATFIILFLVHYFWLFGFNRIMRTLTGHMIVVWREELESRTNKPIFHRIKVRKDINYYKKKYIFYNNIAINIESFKFVHAYRPVLGRYIGQNVFMQFEGKQETIIGNRLHSAHAVRILKKYSIGRLMPPYETKFPTASFACSDSIGRVY